MPTLTQNQLRLVLTCLLSLLALFAAPAWAQSQLRMALLIGNANYQAAPLRNTPNDVREMEAALRAVGFQVQTVLNANQNQMKRAVRDFGSAAQGADVAFFYYSGHATQARGENYLIPVQATIDKEADYEVEAVSANAILAQLVGARPKAAVVVLDACRDNPLAAATKSTSKGLGRMDAPTGSLIAFATAPNTTASDNGLYAKSLARHIRTPGLELLDVFRRTSAEVKRDSGNTQEPRISEVSINDSLYLAGQGSVPPAPAPAPFNRSDESTHELESCRTLLRNQAAEHKNKYPQYSGRFVWLGGSEDETSALADKLSALVGSYIVPGNSQAGYGRTNNVVASYSAGCVGYRSDIFGTREGAVCIAKSLGSGFFPSNECRMAGFPYNVIPK